MKNTICLTQYGSDDPVYLDATTIQNVTQLGAQQFDTGQEEGRRSRVGSAGGETWLVKESADEIMAMIRKATAGHTALRTKGGAS